MKPGPSMPPAFDIRPLGGAARPRSAHDLVANAIGRAILEGEYPVGATLPGDTEMMERFGVSRTALREAMKTLAAKGLIESKTKVGTRVLGEKRWNMFDPDVLTWRMQLGVDLDFLARLFEIRQALEPLAAAAAARYRTDEDLEALTRALDEMSSLPTTTQAFTAADLAFHRAILDAAASPFLRSIGSVIEAALAISFTISSPADIPERVRNSCRQHRAVLDAIALKNPQAAADAMAVVILQGAQSAGIDKRGGAVTIRLQLLSTALEARPA
jgi:DNA-binding FadR family transcriptional regulator